MLKVGVTVGTWASLPMPNFVEEKSLKGIYPSGAKVIPKKRNFGVVGGVSPHFQSHNSENWCKGGNLGLLPMPNFLKNSLKGYTPLGQIYTKKITILLQF